MTDAELERMAKDAQTQVNDYGEHTLGGDALKLLAELRRLRAACSKQNDEVCQTLGRALGYPRYADDQKNFPGATGDDVCVGEHVAETLAMEVAALIGRLRAENAEVRSLLAEACARLEANGALMQRFIDVCQAAGITPPEGGDALPHDH